MGVGVFVLVGGGRDEVPLDFHQVCHRDDLGGKWAAILTALLHMLLMALKYQFQAINSCINTKKMNINLVVGVYY